MASSAVPHPDSSSASSKKKDAGPSRRVVVVIVFLCGSREYWVADDRCSVQLHSSNIRILLIAAPPRCQSAAVHKNMDGNLASMILGIMVVVPFDDIISFQIQSQRIAGIDLFGLTNWLSFSIGLWVST